MNNTPLTTSRKFDPTVYGLQKNQQQLLMLLCFPLAISFIAGMFVFGPNLSVKISVGLAICEAVFFIWVGSNSANLYHFECTMRFMQSIREGMDYIEKHGEEGVKAARGLTHIKKIHDNKYIEYFYTKGRPHNWGVLIKLKSFQPEDLEQFAENIERVFIGMPDKTVIKTFLHVRSDMTDYAEPIRIELRKNRIPQIIRDSMFEFQQMCETAEQKSFENHMLVLLDYTASPEKAKNSLDIIVNSITEILNDMEIGNTILKTEDDILEMFNGHITYNVHKGV